MQHELLITFAFTMKSDTFWIGFFEHVGSSSVPGAISKGDLDIYVGVDPQEHASAVLKLIDCGYKVKADTLRTH